jgi:hypothetical protein
VKKADFVIMNVFKRVIASGGDDREYITSLDLLAFMRDNGLVVSEADCYLVVT